jgi:hypothetical protein
MSIGWYNNNNNNNNIIIIINCKLSCHSVAVVNIN